MLLLRGHFVDLRVLNTNEVSLSNTEIKRNQAGTSLRRRNRRRRRLVVLSYRFLKQGKRYLPPVLRGVLGLVLIVGGILGFLPVLGFWMIPLGIALLATDIPPLRRWLVRRLNHHRRDSSGGKGGN